MSQPRGDVSCEGRPDGGGRGNDHERDRAARSVDVRDGIDPVVFVIRFHDSVLGWIPAATPSEVDSPMPDG